MKILFRNIDLNSGWLYIPFSSVGMVDKVIPISRRNPRPPRVDEKRSTFKDAMSAQKTALKYVPINR